MEVRACSENDARTLADALKGADVFLGLSAAKAMSTDMLKSMADRPIVFAMANPEPEIMPDAAKSPSRCYHSYR